MILFEVTGLNEGHPVYQGLALSNGERHYGFLQSIVSASLGIQRPFLSQTVIKAINYHAIACLHTKAGEYRPCKVTVGDYEPPDHHRVNDLMDDFVNEVNRWWETSDPITLSSYVLWRLNHIHPFINGNGRTARAACYFVLCLKAGSWLGGNPILPELLLQNREDYISALKKVDAVAAKIENQESLAPLEHLILKLLREQGAVN